MLLRVGVAGANKTQCNALSNRLIAFSLCHTEEDVELDIAFYQDLEGLSRGYPQLDMAFVSGELLGSAGLEQLEALYQARPACMTVPTDCSCQQVCGWLAVRPAGHLPTQGDQARIDQLCRRCARLLQKQGNVLQLVTRAGCYAISVDSILLCQSDQKYVLIQLDSGGVYRKLGKLDTLAQSLPADFMRVHQSYLVNPRAIDGLDRSSWELTLKNGQRVPVSRAYHKAVLEQFQKFQFDAEI